MPRKQFLQALQEVRQCLPNGIRHVALDDGETLGFTCYLSTSYSQLTVQLKLLLTNVDDYPAGNGYILFTEDHHLDNSILKSLERLQTRLDRLEIKAALGVIFNELQKVITTGQADDPIQLSDNDLVYSTSAPASSAAECGYDEEMDWDAAEVDSDDGFGFLDGGDAQVNKFPKLQSTSTAVNLAKVKADLLAAKSAGFKVGIHGQLTTGGVVCVSIRVTKLGISEEAMKAWTLSSKKYLVLLIRFKDGYRDLDYIKDHKSPNDVVEMHVALCNRYKPSITQISQAFDLAISGPNNAPQQPRPAEAGELEPLFIGRPLNDLLRDRFARIIKFRSMGLGWSGAERLYNETQGSISHDVAQAVFEQQQQIREPRRRRALAKVVTADALADAIVAKSSLPLVAMQFVLRHLVRCTEFCLACHCPTEDTFEALKPYVCSKPLCLYQFLSYGFGPPVEYEIISQPHVVDLLVTLCYSQTAAHKLKDIPLGLNLKVPLIPEYDNNVSLTHRHFVHPTASVRGSDTLTNFNPSFRAKWNHREGYLTIDTDKEHATLPCKVGDWIALIARDEKIRHIRVLETLYPHIYLSEPIAYSFGQNLTTVPLSDNEAQVKCYTYTHDFDSLTTPHKYQAILTMLKCIPLISTLREQLLEQTNKRNEASLRYVREIPPAARDLLRWIIASNRSCIVQVDTLGGTDVDDDNLMAVEPRVAGMAEWIQFRFAQGAPDKEQRFVDSIQKHATNDKHPTFFAWHGSPLYNWHSIIRHGLNFDEIVHGRASGHGVYMSPNLQVSMGYTNTTNAFIGSNCLTWPNSQLSLSQVVSLQEVVNAPASFVSVAPHFVVAQKEWIQTRYLFVRSTAHHSKKGVAAPSFNQDPHHRVFGADGKALQIPITAIPKQRRPAQIEQTMPIRKGKKPISKAKDLAKDIGEDDNESDRTDAEDLSWFESDDEFFDFHSDGDKPVTKSRVSMLQGSPGDTSNASGTKISRKRDRDQASYILDPSKTDFIPGTLDIFSIRILPPPVDANPASTRALLKVFQALLRTQETTPLDELGWYMDPNRVENMYQWIVELHSFDKSLPLAQDMKRAGLTSVVLELRFTNQFPFSPPFVRVVKPRFLPFLQGGGGHVTEGGAICMELLTSTGWSPISSIESVLLQIRLAMSETERPAKLATTGGRWGHGKKSFDTSCYGIADAVQAFKRACSKHDWKVPEGIDTFTTQG